MSGTGSLIGVPVPVLDEGQYSTIKNHAAIGAEPNNGIELLSSIMRGLLTLFPVSPYGLCEFLPCYVSGSVE